MQIAIVSGKGGAGKTTLATRLFMAVPGSVLLDCDTEEPDAALFFDIHDVETEEVSVRFPLIDGETCTHCGACARFCAFGAILSSPAATFTLPERCHDCGGCAPVCPHGAITWDHRSIGRIIRGGTAGGDIATGELNIGEYSGVKIIRRLRDSAPPDRPVFIDGPPGTACAADTQWIVDFTFRACAAVSAVEEADYAILVGEPTPFGVSDMAMAVEMLRDLSIPFGVVVNRTGIGDREIHGYCRREDLEILGEIPFSRDMADELAAGLKGWGSSRPALFRAIADRIPGIREAPPGRDGENR